DFSNFASQDVQISGSTITVHFPAPEILTTTIDNAQTKVYNRQTGLLTHGDPNLESQARLAAQNSIQSAACQEGILDQASQNARKQVSSLFYSMKFTSVTIDIPEGHCQ